MTSCDILLREWREKNTQRIEDADKKEETDGVSWKEQAKEQNSKRRILQVSLLPIR